MADALLVHGGFLTAILAYLTCSYVMFAEHMEERLNRLKRFRRK